MTPKAGRILGFEKANGHAISIKNTLRPGELAISIEFLSLSRGKGNKAPSSDDPIGVDATGGICPELTVPETNH